MKFENTEVLGFKHAIRGIRMTDEEIRTDNAETLANALERIAELEKENAELKKEVEVNEDFAAVAYMQETSE